MRIETHVPILKKTLHKYNSAQNIKSCNLLMKIFRNRTNERVVHYDKNNEYVGILIPDKYSKRFLQCNQNNDFTGILMPKQNSNYIYMYDENYSVIGYLKADKYSSRIIQYDRNLNTTGILLYDNASGIVNQFDSRYHYTGYFIPETLAKNNNLKKETSVLYNSLKHYNKKSHIKNPG